MAFGKKYEYNPVPEHLGMLLVSEPNMGKSSFAAAMLKPGTVGVVCDADKRFDEVVMEGTNFVPLSNEPSDMQNPKRIYDITLTSMPNKDVSMFVVDSLTAIIEPIILRIQRNVEEGKEKGARGYKEKADAMKYLQAAFTPWNADVIWIYHYRDRGNVYGKMETTTTLSELELARIYRNINIKCEIVVDDKGKRGVHVLEARGGRVGFTIWDESGTWQNIRQRLEKEVWGGLTKEDQVQLLDERNVTLRSPEQAISWAWEFSQNHGEFFLDANHAKNSYNKLKQELVEELGSDLTATVMYETWKQRVFMKEQEKTKEKEKEE